MLDDDPEVNPNSQNLATALVVLGRTTCNFITRGSIVSQGPTVPEHRTNLENRYTNSLGYRPYRPYTSFTPLPHEGQHSTHSPHRVTHSTSTSSLSNAASLQSTTTGPLCGPTKSPSSPPATASLTPPGPPSISMPISPVIPIMSPGAPTFIPTTTLPDISTTPARPDAPTFIPTTTLPNISTTPACPDAPTFIPITTLPDIYTAPAHLSSPTTAHMYILDTQQNDVSMDDEPPSKADCEILMDQDMPTAAPHPLTNHKSASNLPASSARLRPLPLPPITESYLGQLVNQQFSQMSDKIVVPALMSAVEAIILTIIDQIVDEIRGIHSTCSHDPHAWKHSGTSEGASEPECNNDLMPSPFRKHPGKWGIKNHLHDTFQIYLREKRLLQLKAGPLPQSPLPQMVQAFNHDNENPPCLDNITIDWQDSLRSSLWNTEAVNLLVMDFQEKIQTGCYPSVIFDEDTMNLDDLHVLCIDKLCQTQQAYRDHSKIAGLADLQQREEATCELSSRSTRRQRLDRLNTCKHRTLERRRKIAEQNRHRNPQMWDTIRRIIDQLDVDGMSGDETDTSIGAKPKIVRHIALPWISPEITDLLHAVESYTPVTYEENMSVAVGNTLLSRFTEARRTSKNSIAIAQLPRNWYHDNWYKVNSSSAQALLDVHKDFEILLRPCSKEG
ncbi:hypothetical protein DFH29DRAFT_1008929 [Suillus ampliporus]|nr:hypothetical protein DFH29DRAFT_1008929 [Suillus ampliporus]